MKTSKRIALIGILLCIMLTVVVAAKKPFDAELAEQRLDAALARAVTVEDGQIARNAVIHIDAPNYDFTYSGAAGVARADTGEAMTPEHQFTIASVGKTMTAVIVLQLWEEGALGVKGLDATLADLEVFPPDVLDALHRINGVSYGREITVRQLLCQTSGLKDVLMDDENGLGEDYPPEYRGYAPGSLNGVVIFDEEKGLDAMMQACEAGMPTNDYYLAYTWPHWDYAAWTADPADKMVGLLNFYLGGMNETALWTPGTAFHYADTNYIILGLLIEKITGHTLHQELRTRIFDRLGMDRTYLAYADEPTTGLWQGTLSDHWGMGVPLISSGLNLSMDWGAGGEVSTVGDLSVFINSLAAGRLFRHEDTLREMLTLPAGIEQPFYALGIIAWPAGDGLILHHNGAPGSWIEYHTADDLTITGTVNEIDRPDRFLALRADIYSVLYEAGLRSSNFKTGPACLTLYAAMQGGEMPVAALAVLVVCFLIFVTALAAWLIVFIRRRWRGETYPQKAVIARWLAAGTIFSDLAFLLAFILIMAGNPIQFLFGFNSSAALIFLLPLLSIVLTLGLVVFTVLAWRERLWIPRARVHYSLVVMAAIGFLIVLKTYGLLLWP